MAAGELCEASGVLFGVKLGGVISSSANYKTLQRNGELYIEFAATAANKELGATLTLLQNPGVPMRKTNTCLDSTTADIEP